MGLDPLDLFPEAVGAPNAAGVCESAGPAASAV